MVQDTFNFYWSSLRILVEHVFRVIASRWGILWSAIDTPLKKARFIVLLRCKLHNVIIEVEGPPSAMSVPETHEDNDFQGEPVANLQNFLQTDRDVEWHLRLRLGQRTDELAANRHSAPAGVCETCPA